VKSLWAHPVFRSRYLLAILAGLLLTCAFPKVGFAGLAWIAPGLMLAAALGTRGAEAFRIGYAAGLAHYLSMLYWLLLIPYRWHGLPLGPALGWLALSGVLALFFAVWVWGMASAVKRPRSTVHSPQSAEVQSSKSKVQSRKTEAADHSPRSTDVGSPKSKVEERNWNARWESEAEILGGIAGWLPRSWLGRLVWMLAGAAAWVGIEMIMARLLGGFPWDLLGVSQYRMTPLIQMASVTGVYGVSFVVTWVSLSLLSGGVMLIRRPATRSVWLPEIFLPVLTTAALFHIGFRELRQPVPPGRTLNVLLVQPSIPQTLIWDPALDTNRFNTLVAYSDQVLTNQTDLMVWPESAIPTLLRYDTNTLDALSGLARKHHIWIIVGADDVEPKPHARSPEDIDYFNSSFLISPEGELAARYIKRNLAIFGEYVPLQQWLPFLKWLTPVSGGFTPGTGPTEFHLRDLDITTSVLICFEDIFPQLGRSDVRKDTDFLVNITNDGWFGQSAAQWQQAATALFRAVENRVPLIRCCNNGLSCWIDAHGRIQQILRDPRGTVYGKGYLQAQIPVLPRGATHPLTWYTRHGDVFGWACAGFALGLFLLRQGSRWLGTKWHDGRN